MSFSLIIHFKTQFMKTIITSIFSLGIMSAALAQGSVTLSIANSNVKYFVANNGTFFNNPIPGNGAGGYVVPKDSAVSSIFGAFVMATGKDLNGNIKGAIARGYNSDFSPGPYLPNVANYSDSSYTDKYSSALWLVAKSQVDHHIAHWMDSGYVVPGMISSWPANGDSGNGESFLLAPFHDQDGDQIYEPQEGDYPLIRGDRTIYTIINDNKSPHPSGIDPVGMEIHMMFYQYDVPTDDLLTNTVFVQTTVFNRGTVTLQEFHLGHLIDFDLGDPYDDYIGTEPARNLAYIYNGDLNDEDFSGNPGYGVNPPASGIINLDGKLASNVSFPNFTDLNSAATNHNTLLGLLPNGAPVLDGNNQPTKYIYNDIDPNTGWNEFIGLANPPGDRFCVASMDEETFGPGKILCYNHAAIFARSGEGTLTASVDSLFQVADHIQSFYDAQDFYCEAQYLELPEHGDLSFSLYPNPSDQYLRVDGLTSGTYRILNLEGKEVSTGTLENPFIRVEFLKNGYYMLEITSGGKGGRKSFIKDGN
ncbi:hypothetical protein D3C87_07350 [compost metagenome]